MVVFSPVAQQPSSGIEDRLQAIQEILRSSDQQTIIAIDLCCDEGCRKREKCCDEGKSFERCVAGSRGLKKRLMGCIICVMKGTGEWELDGNG